MKERSGVYVVDSDLVYQIMSKIVDNLKLDKDRINEGILSLYLSVTLAVPNIVLTHFHLLVEELDRQITSNVRLLLITLSLIATQSSTLFQDSQGILVRKTIKFKALNSLLGNLLTG